MSELFIITFIFGGVLGAIIALHLVKFPTWIKHGGVGEPPDHKLMVAKCFNGSYVAGDSRGLNWMTIEKYKVIENDKV